jgi:O-acetylserine/cysteine efflux transporter
MRKNNSFVFKVISAQCGDMPVRDRLLATSVAVLWGINFLAIHATLEHFPPLFAGALRFVVIAVPTLLLVPRPQVPLRWLIGYGLGFGTGQFAFLFVGMHAGMPTGLASLVLQASAPFTVLLGWLLLGEKLSWRAVTGILLAVGGMAAIAWRRAEYAAVLPVLLTVLAALSWAIGNLCSRKALEGRPDVNPLHVMLWMCIVPPVPLYALSVIFEGPAAGWQALTTVATPSGWLALAGLAYIVLAATITGTGIWTALMRRNPATAVAPFSLLVPIVGMTSAMIVLGEQPSVVELVAGAVVITGVLLGSLPGRKKVQTPTVDAEALEPAPQR